MRILIDIGIYLFGVLSGITCIALAAAGRKNFDEGRDEKQRRIAIFSTPNLSILP